MQFRQVFFLLLTILTIACSPRLCRVSAATRLQICQDTRRQIIFLNNNDPTLYPYQYMAATWIHPTRQALLFKRYKEFHCDEILGECVPSGVYRQGVTPLPDVQCPPK
jgi:hypothetical protein